MLEVFGAGQRCGGWVAEGQYDIVGFEGAAVGQAHAIVRAIADLPDSADFAAQAFKLQVGQRRHFRIQQGCFQVLAVEGTRQEVFRGRSGNPLLGE